MRTELCSNIALGNVFSIKKPTGYSADLKEQANGIEKKARGQRTMSNICNIRKKSNEREPAESRA
jgi:hypothetical protein